MWGETYILGLEIKKDMNRQEKKEKENRAQKSTAV